MSSSGLSSFTASGTRVAGGRHVVPPGVLVEQLPDTNHDELLGEDRRSLELRELLECADLAESYGKVLSRFVKKGVKSSKWLEPKLAELLQEARPAFMVKEVKISLCECRYFREGDHFRWLWLEIYRPRGELASYESPYDVTNHRSVAGGWHLVPQTGVVVEELSELDPRALVKKCPEDVREFMESRGLVDLYKNLTKALYESNGTRTFVGGWKTSKLREVLEGYREEFASRDVEVAVCKFEKAQWDYVKWIEFIDRKKVPDYWPPHDVDQDRVKRQISSRSSQFSFASFNRSSLLCGTTGESGGVVVQPLMVDGQPKISSECPPDLEQLLRTKDLLEEYSRLDAAVSVAKNVRNFLDIWRMLGEGVIVFAPIKELQATFFASGVKILLCESVGRGGEANCWLEFVDVERNPTYENPFSVTFNSATPQSVTLGNADEGGSKTYKKVAGGRHYVPVGVAVKELEEFSKLTDDCPDDVRQFLSEKVLFMAYEDFITALTNTKRTRGYFENWKGTEILEIMEGFVEIFLARGVRMVLCKIKPDKGRSFRWIEFIDVKLLPGYVPPYDMTNYGDEELETAMTTLKFPNGVAIQSLEDRKTLVEVIPPSVQAMLDKKDCFALYVALVDVLCESGGVDLGNGFSKNQVRTITRILAPKFEAQGVAIFFSVKSEKDERGNDKSLYWLEFVDRELQPNYYAQRGVDLRQFSSEGISAEEVKANAFQAGKILFGIGLELAFQSQVQ